MFIVSTYKEDSKVENSKKEEQEPINKVHLIYVLLYMYSKYTVSK